MSEIDKEYFRARLNAERTAAAAATCEEARAAHQALADEYANLLDGDGHRIANDQGVPDSIQQRLSY
jgi:hypothetical protein